MSLKSSVANFRQFESELSELKNIENESFEYVVYFNSVFESLNINLKIQNNYFR